MKAGHIRASLDRAQLPQGMLQKIVHKCVYHHTKIEGIIYRIRAVMTKNISC